MCEAIEGGYLQSEASKRSRLALPHHHYHRCSLPSLLRQYCITTPLQPTIITAMAMLPPKSRYFNLSLIIFQPDCRSYKGLYFLLHHLVMFDTSAMIIIDVLAVIFVMIRVVMISYMCDPLRWSPG